MVAAFEFTTSVEHLLFENVNISTVAGLVIACALITLLSGMYEIIHFFRQYLIYKTKSKLQKPLNESSQLCPKDESITTTVNIQIHCAQSLFHILQVLIGYILMLCVMKFNAYILLCVLIAIGIVYFLLGATMTQYVMNSSDEFCSPKTPSNQKPKGSHVGHQSYSSFSKDEETEKADSQ